MKIDEIEFLIGADISDVEQAERDVKKIRDRIEKNPAQQKVTGDDKDALASMDRVEKTAKKLVSKDAALKLEADIARAEKSLATTNRTLEGLQIKALGGLDVTAETKRAENAIARTEKQLEALTRAKSLIEVEADPTIALAGLAKVERSGKQLVSQDIALRVNAEVDRATVNIAKLEGDLAILRTRPADVRVEADIKRVTANLDRARSELKALDGARAEMVVDVNEGGARKKLSAVSDYASDAGEDAGAEMGDGIVAALLSIPIAGAVVGIGVQAGKALAAGVESGLSQEVGRDRLEALTGITPQDALRLSRVAAQAYTQGFGESVEKNMDTARLGLQFRLIDPEMTNRDSQRVIQGLEGISDVLDEDVRPTATAVSTLLRSGLAKSADEAYDIIAAGARNGLNRNEDLLDTLTEYPVVLARLGLSGKDALGLINQGLEAGGRNTDVLADALKEFQIRATDGSKLSAAGFERLGLNAEEMTAKIARGGTDARDGLALVLDKLREIEDPVQRNAAAVELFGTKAEDLGDALFALDLDTAADGLGKVEGAAQKMFDTLADNDATKLEGAKRNIEVAVQGIQGALASAFSDPLDNAATFVSENRGPMLQFLQDLTVGALDFGISLVTAAADGTEGFGELVSGPLASTIDAAGKLAFVLGDYKSSETLLVLAENMRGFDETTQGAADSMRDRLIPNMQEARDKAAGFFEGEVAMGYLNDATNRLAGSVEQLGYTSDGARISMEGIDLANLRASESGRLLEEQLRNGVGALGEQISAAQATGESQQELTNRYNAGRDALISQMEQMGISREVAAQLIDTVLKTPTNVATAYGSNADEQRDKVQGLATRIETLPDGSVVIRADTNPAEADLQRFLNGLANKRVTIATGLGGTGGITQHDGGLVEFMASGGIRGGGLTPMSPIAQMVPANTWRVVGDRGDVVEAFIPLDGSARSRAIQAEVNRMMPPEGMGGSVVVAGGGGASNVRVSADQGWLRELIQVEIETAEGWKAVNFDNGTSR